MSKPLTLDSEDPGPVGNVFVKPWFPSWPPVENSAGIPADPWSDVSIRSISSMGNALLDEAFVVIELKYEPKVSFEAGFRSSPGCSAFSGPEPSGM